MNTSWENTRRALRNFANVLKCYKCGNEPINATKYTNCCHFFCKQCIEKDLKCVICNTPVRPLEICNDHLIKNLVSYCNNIAEIIQERDLWNSATNSNAIELSAITNNSICIINSSKYTIPKNINKRNAKGETYLHIACVKNQERHVKNLLAAGAEPNTKDFTGWTPLQEVVSFGYTNICQLLLEYKALPNTPGKSNRRALHDAAINNRLAEAKILLKYSADKNVYDDHGKKPIDYCELNSEMWDILKEENKFKDTTKKIINHNCTFNKSFSVQQTFDMIVIYPLNLREENKNYLNKMALKHKIKIMSVFRPSVTHVIVEANDKNIIQLSYDIMRALVRGIWLLNTEWIQLSMDISDILKGDLELFEVSGAPIEGIPKKARESAQNWNPGLFNQCYFYFAFQSRDIYINDIHLTKDALITLVQEGKGIILKREPNPEDIKTKEKFVPFHIANEPSHSLHECTHYIIYIPEKDEPRIKYNMPHIKTLPLIWLIECIEKFTLIDPLQLGLLKF
ncbi:LOW QUALITY PROTEIN: BRCA1-associated RING domain protein 1-like [Apis florea]|uniref:LOW QUALITY PROTEIN: BRCA1-associated RING domain protein 1-like n=1 Tax=Apis florea TaxID=7463 RepID=UPI0006299B56|nr:LOW QUALITY PROTEIN: BRCA1-associated RING domain protein 1-like [Apis florea]